MVKTFRFDNVADEFCSNTYVVGEKGGPCIVIDLGTTSNKIIDYIKENFTTCNGVLITHGHWDHIRGLNNFFKVFNCTLFIDEQDAECLINSRLNCSETMEGKGKVNIEPYRLEDEDEIRFENHLGFKVIETPFHTKGSVCFLCEKEHCLFTGDTLFKGSIGRSDLPHSQVSMQVSSLEKLKKLDPNLIIYPGHGDCTTLENELKNNIYLK